MYCIREDDVIAWARYNDLQFIQCACRFTERTATQDKESQSKRREIKNLIRELSKHNPDLESSIFHSLHAVNLDTFPAYKTKGAYHSFLEQYETPDKRD